MQAKEFEEMTRRTSTKLDELRRQITDEIKHNDTHRIITKNDDKIKMYTSNIARELLDISR